MKKAFIFPGQGVQYPGMGADFIEGYAVARTLLEEADDILGRNLSDIILRGPKATLTETHNSQSAIYVVSVAILKVIREVFPELKPSLCAGLSLGEYTAATAAGYLPFTEGLPLVQYRGQYMSDACEKNKGTMAVILGLEAEQVEDLVKQANMPNDLWAANFNCPGQVVISGTEKGIECGSMLAKEHGAKRILPLQVHGAFHSGLMLPAKEQLAQHFMQINLNTPSVGLVMNVPGAYVLEEEAIKKNLIEQVISPVRWEMGVHTMEKEGVELYIEMGPGKTLSGFNKRIGTQAPTISIEKVEDLKKLEKILETVENL